MAAGSFGQTPHRANMKGIRFVTWLATLEKPIDRRLSSGGSHADPKREIAAFAWILIGLAMLVWSLLSWLLYSFTDPVLAWLATSLDLVVDRGQDTAKTLGNKSAGDILAALDTSSLPGQLLGMLKSTGKGASSWSSG